MNVHLKPGPELEKAQREVAEHQRFAALVEEVTPVSEAICAARPAAGRRRPLRRRGKGGAPGAAREIAAAEVTGLAGLAAGMLGAGAALGVLEQAMRAALAASGARLLEAVLAGDGDGYAGPRVKCASGHQAAFAGSRPKTITTVLGPVRVMRAWYHCRECGHGFAPRDEQLGTAGTPLSPGLREMIARAGAEVPFGKAAALLADLAGIAVSARTSRAVRRGIRRGRAGSRRRGGRRDPRPHDPPAAPARAGPGHAVCRGGRHRRPGPPQRNRRPQGQGR